MASRQASLAIPARAFHMLVIRLAPIAKSMFAVAEVLPGQLRGGHPGQHLTAGESPPALLDRAHRLIQGLDQAELAAQLGHREHPARAVSDGSAPPICILPQVRPR